jgi:hypothetical protein
MPEEARLYEKRKVFMVKIYQNHEPIAILPEAGEVLSMLGPEGSLMRLMTRRER